MNQHDQHTANFKPHRINFFVPRLLCPTRGSLWVRHSSPVISVKPFRHTFLSSFCGKRSRKVAWTGSDEILEHATQRQTDPLRGPQRSLRSCKNLGRNRCGLALWSAPQPASEVRVVSCLLNKMKYTLIVCLAALVRVMCMLLRGDGEAKEGK